MIKNTDFGDFLLSLGLNPSSAIYLLLWQVTYSAPISLPVKMRIRSKKLFLITLNCYED